MKPYRVLYTNQFEDALDAQVLYFLKQGASKARVVAWLTDLYELTDSLETFPHRFPVAELESVNIGVKVHKIVFGD